MIENIFIYLLNEGVDVWRPVKAEIIDDGKYKILDENSEVDEDWEFKPGDIVLCKEKIFSDGIKGLVAFKKIMKNSPDYNSLIKLIIEGDTEALEDISKVQSSFPKGKDDFLGRDWITNIIDCGTHEVLVWALSKNVNLHFRDDEGRTPLHAAIDREDQGSQFVETLIKNGADIDAHGINDWTPLHQAAIREQIEIMKLLIDHGANVYAKTRIDTCGTPLEEARLRNRSKSVEFLEKIMGK